MTVTAPAIGPRSAPDTGLVTALRREAEALGFDALAIAPAELPRAVERDLAGFLRAGYHGSMDWLAAHSRRRRQPKALWPETGSVIALAMSYAPEAPPLANLERPLTGNLSVYARGRDYHEVIKPRLKRLARWLLAEAGGEVKVFVDTAPVMEKPLTALSGLGWQGKHTNLLSRDLGNWFFLGLIFTSLALPAGTPAESHCGTCRACLDVCPTDAFPAPYRLDARRCISYLTIEHKGPVPRALRQALGNRIYGCDDCLAVCPWNKFARRAHDSKLMARDDLLAPDLATLAEMDEAAFRRFFTASPVKRIGWSRFMRNVLLALGNSGENETLPLVIRRLEEAEPLVRGAAVWALSRLDRSNFEARRAWALDREFVPQVRAEWKERDLEPTE